jgi:5'-methylthioadenosine/S-adenosylhomocysteine nucleosidase
MQNIPLAVVAALDDEIRPLLSKMTVDARIHVRPGRITKGQYRNNALLLVRSGIGRRAMRNVITHLLASFKPDLIIHTGYCGGADPVLTVGDLVIAESVVDAASGKIYPGDASLLARAHGILKAKNIRGRAGKLVTIDRVATSPHDKAFLATQHAAIGIDMESSELADALAQTDIPCIVVRAVLDPLDFHFPNISDVVEEDGSTDAMALIEHLVRKPGEIARLPKIQYLASQAREAIAAFLDAWIDTEEA